MGELLSPLVCRECGHLFTIAEPNIVAIAHADGTQERRVVCPECWVNVWRDLAPIPPAVSKGEA